MIYGNELVLTEDGEVRREQVMDNPKSDTPRLSPGGTRANHLAWCKQRANEHLDRDDVSQAWASMCSDLNKHPETAGHSGMELGMMQVMAGMLKTTGEMRRFIDGFN